MSKRSPVLILGGSGWIGSACRQATLLSGSAFLAPSRSWVSNFLSQRMSGTRLSEISSLGIRGVINCIRPSGDVDGLQAYVRDSQLFAQICLDLDLPYIHLGSAAEYGLSYQNQISESFDPKPESAYGIAKLLATEIALKHGATVLRPFNLMGPGQPAHTVVGDWVNQILKSGDCPRVLLQHPAHIRDFVSPNFLANVALRAIELGLPGHVLNVCSGQGHAFIDVVRRLISARFGHSGIENVDHFIRLGNSGDTCTSVIGNPGKLEALGFSSHDSLVRLSESLFSSSDANSEDVK